MINIWSAIGFFFRQYSWLGFIQTVFVSVIGAGFDSGGGDGDESFGFFGELSEGLVVIFTPILPDSSENNFDETSALRLEADNSFRLGTDAGSSLVFDLDISFFADLDDLSSFSERKINN